MGIFSILSLIFFASLAELGDAKNPAKKVKNQDLEEYGNLTVFTLKKTVKFIYNDKIPDTMPGKSFYYLTESK